MSLVWPARPAWVSIGLDTTPPDVDLAGAWNVQPPTPLKFTAHSSKVIDHASIQIMEPHGVEVDAGYSLLDPQTLSVALPTDYLVQGHSSLVVTIWDAYGNAGVKKQTIQVMRKPVFRVQISAHPYFETSIELS